MKTEISLIQNDNIFIFKHINQTVKSIKICYNIQVNNMKKRPMTYTRDNPNIHKTPNIQSLMKYTDEKRFDVTSLSD